MIRFFFITLSLFSFFSCVEKVSDQEKHRLYEEKGYNTMNNRLKPEIVNVKDLIYSIRDIGIDGSIAAMDQNAQFGIINFDDELKPTFNPVVKNYPGQAGIFKTDPETRVMWLVAGRGIYTLDTDTKTKGHTVVSNDGNARIIESFIADRKNKILLAGDSSGGASTFTLFDVLNNKKIYSQLSEGLGYSGIVFPFYENHLLGMDYMSKDKESSTIDYIEWYVCDLYMKSFSENEITKILNKLQITVENEVKSIDLQKRIILGYPYNTYRPNFIIKWNEKIEDVNAIPILVQMPDSEKSSTVYGQMLVSYDGNWMKTTLEKMNEGMFDVPEILIYHLSDIYPQGISMPIYCGLTKEGTDGAFFNHKKFGPCFVEFDIDNPNKLFVYKLNDGLKILTSQLRSVVEN
jgi:hypothetical protein